MTGPLSTVATLFAAAVPAQITNLVGLSSNHVVPPGFTAFAPPPGLSCNHHVCNTQTMQHTQKHLPQPSRLHASQHQLHYLQLRRAHHALTGPQLQAQQAHHTHQLQQQHAAHLQAMQLLIQQVLTDIWEWLRWG